MLRRSIKYVSGADAPANVNPGGQTPQAIPNSITAGPAPNFPRAATLRAANFSKRRKQFNTQRRTPRDAHRSATTSTTTSTTGQTPFNSKRRKLLHEERWWGIGNGRITIWSFWTSKTVSGRDSRENCDTWF